MGILVHSLLMKNNVKGFIVEYEHEVGPPIFFKHLKEASFGKLKIWARKLPCVET